MENELIEIKKPTRKRKVVNVIYQNDLPTDVIVKTLKQKIEEKYLPV